MLWDIIYTLVFKSKGIKGITDYVIFLNYYKDILKCDNVEEIIVMRMLCKGME